jgi:uncharacterized protein (TIGR03382 family)
MRSQRAVLGRLLVFVAGLGLLSCGETERLASEPPRSGHSRLASAPAWYASANLATARTQHATVLLPNGKLLVINGINTSGFVRAAELFDPDTNAWTPAGNTGIEGNVTQALLLPNGRVFALADGSATGALYDPATGTWSATGAMAQTRGQPTLTLLNSGQVLIAGGTNGGTRLASAELYDPATNTFTATGAMTLARNAHAATLLRDGRVLAVSGFNGSGEVAGVDRYDPTTGTWTAVAPPLVPRHYATSTLLPDGRVLLAGGFAAGSATFQSELYDPTTNAWTATGDLLRARSGHSATLLPDGRVLVTGGSASAGSAPEQETEVYDPVTGNWSDAGPLNDARENHTATLLPSGKVLLVGGYTSAPATTMFASTELYDPSISRWTPAGSMGTPRAFPLVTLLPSGQVLVIAGRGTSGSSSATELYDPTANSWTTAASLSTARERATATLLRSGQVLVVGGRNSGGSTDSVERYDPALNSWIAATPLPGARHLHTATLLPDGRLFVAGGQINQSVIVTANLYSPDTNTWAPAAPLGLGRAGHRAVLLPSGQVLVVGGHDSTGAETATAELYDPATDSWSPAASLDEARDELSLTLLPSGRVLAVGGIAALTQLASAEIYDPASNSWSPVGPLSQPRLRHTATLLPSGKVVVAGGFTTFSAYADTAESYDPMLGIWTNVNDPALRGEFASTALPSGAVLFAGGDAITTAERFDDTNSQPSWHPTVNTPAVLVANCPTVLEGLLFRGISSASGSSADSPTNFPLVRLRGAEGGRLWTLPSTDTSTTRATVTVPAGVPLGTYGLSVFANALPGGRMVTVAANRAPTATDQAVTAREETPVTVTLGATDPDAGQVLSWTVVTQPQHGTLTGTPPNLIYTPNPGYVGPDSFTFRVRDCVEDSNVATVSLTVEAGPPPTLTCPADVTSEATGPDGALVDYGPAVSDPPGVPVTYSQASGSRFPLGTTTVTASIGGGVTCAFRVIVRDTTAPTLTCPANTTAEPGTPVTFTATATDTVTATPTVTSSPASGSTFPAGNTRVTVTATDEAGNSAQCTFDVSVRVQVVAIKGGGCDSTSTGAASALALLAVLSAWSGSRRRTSRGQVN